MEDLYLQIIEHYRSISLLYVAGAFTSQSQELLDDLTKQADIIALEAWRCGWSVISPHKNCLGYMPDEDMDYQKWMNALVAQISRCDALLLLPGWEHSKGVQMEVRFAKEFGIPVYDYAVSGIPEPEIRNPKRSMVRGMEKTE